MLQPENAKPALLTRAQQQIRWATVWPQQTWAENRAACPLLSGGGELGPHLTQRMARAEAYLHAKFHLGPSNRWPQYTNITDRQTAQTGQDRQDRQRSDSIEQTVLQTVAQNQMLQATFLSQKVQVYTLHLQPLLCSPPRKVPVKVIQGHRFRYQSKAHIRFL